MADHTERITTAIEDAASRLIQALAVHEEHDHAGEPCGRARVTAIGYLAARIGIGSEGEMLLVNYWRREFQRRQEQAEKGHHAN